MLYPGPASEQKILINFLYYITSAQKINIIYDFSVVFVLLLLQFTAELQRCQTHLVRLSGIQNVPLAHFAPCCAVTAQRIMACRGFAPLPKAI